MKKIITILFLLVSVTGYSQNEICYDTASNTVYAIHEGDSIILGYRGAENPTLVPFHVLNKRIRRIAQQLPFVSVLNNNVTSTSATPSNVNELSFNGKAGKIYRIELIADYQTAATTTGCIVGLATNGSGNVRGFIKGSVSATAVATELNIPLRSFSGAGSSLTTTGVSATNTPHSIHIVAVIRCTADGVFGVRFGSEVEGSQAQLNAGSVLIVQEL